MAKEAAAPAAKKQGAPRGPRGIPLDAKIAFGVQKVAAEGDKPAKEIPYGPKNNPKREGTKAAARFDLYKAGMTVAKAIEAGMKSRHIIKDVKKGYITHSGGTPEKAA